MINRKFLGVSVFLCLLVGCDASYKEINYPILPEELRDCKFYSIDNGDGYYMKVVRCPHSDTSTSYREGKVDRTAVVIES